MGFMVSGLSISVRIGSSLRTGQLLSSRSNMSSKLSEWRNFKVEKKTFGPKFNAITILDHRVPYKIQISFRELRSVNEICNKTTMRLNTWDSRNFGGIKIYKSGFTRASTSSRATIRLFTESIKALQSTHLCSIGLVLSIGSGCSAQPNVVKVVSAWHIAAERRTSRQWSTPQISITLSSAKLRDHTCMNVPVGSVFLL